VPRRIKHPYKHGPLEIPEKRRTRKGEELVKEKNS
jgi:hypothetical protein